LIEENISGVELGCGVYKVDGKIVSLPITEIVSKTDFFDYVAKYEGLSDEITPARISEKETEECQRLSRYLYKEYNCKGIVRFDYILSDNKFYFLEVNTIPGFSKASIIPQQLREAGIAEEYVYDKILTEIISNKPTCHS